jgi:hypothetical protein
MLFGQNDLFGRGRYGEVEFVYQFLISRVAFESQQIRDREGPEEFRSVVGKIILNQMQRFFLLAQTDADFCNGSTSQLSVRI